MKAGVVSAFAIALAVTLFAASAAAQDADEHLLRGDVFYLQGDYYRAITEYKYFLLESADDPRTSRVDLKIAYIYHISERPDAAAELLRHVALERRNEPEGYWAKLYTGHVAMAADEPARAKRAYEEVLSGCAPVLERTDAAPGIARRDCLELTARAQLGVARYWATIDDFDSAAEALGSIPRSAQQADDARKVAQYIATLNIPQKSPAVAGALSVIPGLGHFYLEEWGTGVVAMIWNGAFIFATVDSFAAGRIGQGTLLGLLELVWYGGTIFGAVSGAHRFNRDARLIVREGLVRDIDRMAVDTPWPARFPVPYPAPLQLEFEF